MYGTRFGGAGASGGWRGSTGRRTWTSGNRGGGWRGGRRFARGGARTRGGNVSWLTSIALPALSTEATAVLAFVPFLHAGYWLDQQLVAETTQWEGSLEAVKVVHGQWRIQLWPVAYIEEANAQLLVPVHVGLAIVPAYDVAGTGDPNDFAPTALPNYFVRDWGHIARQQVISPDSTTYAGPAELAQRTLFRDACLIDFSDVALDRTDPCRYVFRAITKPFVVRRHDMFGLVINAYNTHPTDQVTLGYRLTGHFGYRRLRRAE